jgi:topoisomerase-4 subunit A
VRTKATSRSGSCWSRAPHRRRRAAREACIRLTDLEVRFPLNLNVSTRTARRRDEPQGGAAAWLQFQIEVARPQQQVRIGKIDDRLELLDGFLIAYLNLDRSSKSSAPRTSPSRADAEFSLTDRQAEAILNMRLRSLRRLEEMEIGREREAGQGAEELEKLVDDPAAARRLKKDLRRIKEQFGDDRRPRIEEVAATREIDWSAMIEKEPITVILSQRGWIRAMRGHVALDERRR